MTSAAALWNSHLMRWGIPQHILDQAPESPWALPPQLFARAAVDPRDTPSRLAALDALPQNGTVLDVGCGPGAASLALAAKAPDVTGVDDNEEMLGTFVSLANDAGVRANAVKGRWPDVAGGVAPADVVVCHHVVYNVPDIEPFLRELNAHATKRVVLELTERHPLTLLKPLWLRFWNLERTARPTADDLESVLSELGHDVTVEGFDAASDWNRLDEMTPWVRRWLCLPADRDGEIRAALEADPPPSTRRLVTMWWDA